MMGEVEVAPYWNVNTYLDKIVCEEWHSRSSSILECKYVLSSILVFTISVEVAP